MGYSNKVLGLDMGTNSIGWAYIDKENKQILGIGTVLFHDSRTKSAADPIGESGAVARRKARMMRRQRDRKLYSYERVAKFLCETLNIKQIDFSKNPYEARSIAAKGTDDPNTLARALLHLRKRRGFASNRKSAKGEEGNSYSDAIINLKGELRGISLSSILKDKKIPEKPKTDAQKKAKEQAKKEWEKLPYIRTLGQFLHDDGLDGETKNSSKEETKKPLRRFRYNEVFFSNDIYPLRDLYEIEFETIRKNNKSAMASDQWDRLMGMIFNQRPLKQQIIGKCRFYESQNRASKHLPTSHEFRLCQELQNLRVIGEGENYLKEHLPTIWDKLQKQKTYSYSAIRKDLNLSSSVRFKSETDNKTGIIGNLPMAEIHNIAESLDMDVPNLQRNEWDSVVELALKIDDDDKFSGKVVERIPQEFALKIKEWADRQGASYGALSKKCMNDLLCHMQDDEGYPRGLPYDQAERQLEGKDGKPLSRSHENDVELMNPLPYYGSIMPSSMQPAPSLASDVLQQIKEENPHAYEEIRYGKIANPTVHVALNQLVKLVNEIIEIHGQPDKINIELSRDLKNSKARREKINREIKENTENRKRLKKIHEEHTKTERFSRDDYQKMKFWEELGEKSIARNCLYCGNPISQEQLFSPNDTQIEHILPRSWSYDDSPANKTIVHLKCNQGKEAMTPYEFLGERPFERAEKAGLKSSKLWRFSPDAREIFEKKQRKILTDEELAEHGNDIGDAWRARQMTDTQYISRTARNILSRTVGHRSKVMPLSGKLTADLRHQWSVWNRLIASNHKPREDSRHHAVDAFVIAMADWEDVQKAARASAEKNESPKYAPLPEWAVKQLRERFDKIIVHEKPDHGIQGSMFKETAYSQKVTEREREQGFDAITRITLQAYVADRLNKLKRDNQPDRKPRSLIRDPILREKIDNLIRNNADKQQKELCDYIYQETGIRRLRMIMKKNLVAIPSAPYKAYERDDFCAVNIWKVPQIKNGKFSGKYKYEGIFIPFDVAAKIAKLAKHPKKLSRLNKFDKNDGILQEFGKPHPSARFTMRLHKKDMVALAWDEDLKEKLEKNSGSDISIKPITIDSTEYIIAKIDSFSTTNNCVFISHQYAANPKQMMIAIGTLMEKHGMRKLRVTPTGRYSLHKYRG